MATAPTNPPHNVPVVAGTVMCVSCGETMDAEHDENRREAYYKHPESDCPWSGRSFQAFPVHAEELTSAVLTARQAEEAQLRSTRPIASRQAAARTSTEPNNQGNLPPGAPPNTPGGGSSAT